MEIAISEVKENLEVAIHQFFEGDVSLFNSFLSSIDPSQREQMLARIRSYAEPKFNAHDLNLLFRRIGQHPDFEKYFDTLPTRWGQGVVFINTPQLTTRFCISYFDHPAWIQRPVDYNFLIFSHQGDKVANHKLTIHPKQTHTHEIADILKEHPNLTHGMFYLQSVEKHLGSLRIYAYWYNENSMTTTHEKSSYVNGSPLLAYPVVVLNEDHETYVAISNLRKSPYVIRMQLQNSHGEYHPDIIKLEFKPRSTALLPLSSQFKNSHSFLKDGPGSLYVKNDGGQGMYYYFIHNKRFNSWQIQHL